MTQGLNIRADIWRINQAADDAVGGAVLTGTVAYPNLLMSIYSRRPSQQSLEQGLEVPALFDATTKACGVDIRERDEIEVSCPPSHPYYGMRFRVMGVALPKRRRGGEQHLTLSRIRQSRRVSY